VRNAMGMQRSGARDQRSEKVFQAADDLAAIFDRLGGFDVEFEGEKRDGHAEIRG